MQLKSGRRTFWMKEKGYDKIYDVEHAEKNTIRMYFHWAFRRNKG